MNLRYYNNTSSKIHELADRAHELAHAAYYERMKTEHAADVIFYDIFNQCFAELIISECRDLVIDDYNGYQLSDKLKQHFNLNK